MTDRPHTEPGNQPQTGHQPWCHDWDRCPECREIARRYYPYPIGGSPAAIGGVARYFGSTPVMTFKEQGQVLGWGFALVLCFLGLLVAGIYWLIEQPPGAAAFLVVVGGLLSWAGVAIYREYRENERLGRGGRSYIP